MSKPILIAVLVAALSGAPGFAAQESHLDNGAPVELPIKTPAGADDILKAKTDTGIELVLQKTPALFSSPRVTDLEQTYCAIVPGGLAKWRVLSTTAADLNPAFAFADIGGGRRQLSECQRPVLVYNYGLQLVAGVPEDRRRSSYVHPIFDPRGNILTDDFPADHHHHRGLSWMWPKVTVAGTQYDLWHIQGVRHQFEDWLCQDTGPVCAILGVKNGWHLNNRKIVDEWIWLRVFRLRGNAQCLDVRLTWQAIEPVQLLGADQKGYGGLCLRFAPRKDTVITAANGLHQADSDLLKLPWADESGKFGDSDYPSGIAVFQHAGNPGFPAGWCLRHYGFIGVSWPGLEPAALEPGRPMTLRFRIMIHSDDAQCANVSQAYETFSAMPEIVLK